MSGQSPPEGTPVSTQGFEHDSQEGPPAVQPMFPRRFGQNFVLLKPLGSGGMASVFLAMRAGGLAPTLSAIKKVRRGANLDHQKEIERRFLDEARLVTQLRHRNIVSVTEAGFADGDAFLAMEPIRGKTLHEMWVTCSKKQLGMRPMMAAYIAKEVATGLAYAHGAADGTVHRDIAPSNIIVSYDGDVKILDFGIATWGKKEVNTATGIVWGHKNYAAPEYLRSEPIDGRADLYSLGLILLEWLVGRVGPDAESAARGRVSFAESLAAVPHYLRDVVKKLIDPDVEERFGSAAEARDELSHVLRGHGGSEELAKFMRGLYEGGIDEEERELAALVQKGVQFVSSGPRTPRVVVPDGVIAELERLAEGPDSREATSDPLVGKLFGGKYRVEEVLGQGAMGRVYRARHEGLRRDVAIKVARSIERRQERERIRRFKQEAEIMSKLVHQNIATVFDSGTTDEGDFYFVMEYLNGCDLDSLVKKRGPQDVDRVLELGLQICEGLAVAHHHDVIHRDLKPANVMLVRTPVEGGDLVKILDFGVAKLLRADLVEDPAQSHSRSFVGTPAYMAPEQRAAASDIDARVDVFAVGGILFYLLAGQAPDAAETDPERAPAKHRAVLKIAAPDLPAEVERIVLSCLSPDRRLRPEGANALRSQLALALEAEYKFNSGALALRSLPITDVVDRRPFFRRRPFVVAVGSAALLGVAAIGSWFARSPEPAGVVDGAAESSPLQVGPSTPAPPTSLRELAPTQEPPASKSPPGPKSPLRAPVSPPSVFPVSGAKNAENDVARPEAPEPPDLALDGNSTEASPPGAEPASLAVDPRAPVALIAELLDESEHALQAGQIARATEAARKAIEVGAGARGHLALARIHFSLERWSEALTALDAALALEPGNALALRGRKRVLIELEGSDER